MELGKAKKVRAGHKGYVNKVIAQVNQVCEEYEGSPSQREHLLGLKSSLTEKVETIKKLDEQILEAVKEEEIEKEIEESGEFCETVYRCLAKIETCLGAQSVSVESDAPKAKSSQMQGPKLPKLTLKEFSGNPAKWQTFWDSFETAIHKNDQLSEIDKFNYLRGCLHGSAASAIEGISLTRENYKVAVDILVDRFANPQLLIASHMDSLLKLPSVNEVKQISKLRELYDKIEVNVRSLNSLGIKPGTYGSLLAPIIMSKIPTDLRLIISRGFNKEKTWKIDELLNAIKLELEVRERCETMKVSDNRDNISTGAAQSSNKITKPERQFTASALSVGKTQNIYCTFCKKQHPSVKCDVYNDPASRRAIVRQKAKCFICLKSGHMVKHCQSTRVCQNCAGRHHTALCDKVKAKNDDVRENKYQDQEKTSEPSPESGESKSTSSLNVCANSKTLVLLQTAVAPVGRPDNPQEKVNVRIILDSGSQRSYVTHKLKEYLQLNSIAKDHLLIKTFGEEIPRLKSCELVQLSITSVEGMELYVNAYSVPTICSPLSNQTVQLVVNKYPHLQDLELADMPSNSEDVKIEVLIGADYYWNFVTGTIKRSDIPGPIAMYTKLGWVLSGPVVSEFEANQACSVQLNSTHILKVEANPLQLGSEEQINMHEELKRFWDLESLGICNDELSVYDKFTQAIQFDGKRYEAELPFKEECPLLPDNHTICVSRLNTLLSRLRGNPEVLKEYNSIIQDQLKQGIVEVVPKESATPGKVHYLPHREVIRMDKETTKLRIVYDASARSNGPSLNDCLLSGPSLSPLIFDILTRFRLNSVGMTADIEKAFLNIAINPEHRDYLRFLWVDDPFSETPIIQHMRFARVVFGVTSSPFILNATIRHHMNQYITSDAEFVQEVLRSLYVDDYASGANDPASAFVLSRKIKSTLAEGGFNMRKWTSNSQDLMDMWKESKEFPEITSAFDHQSPVVEEDQGYS